MKLYYRIWCETRRDGSQSWRGQYWQTFEWTWNPGWLAIQVAMSAFGGLGWQTLHRHAGLGEMSVVIGTSREDAEAHVRSCAGHTTHRLREEHARKIVAVGDTQPITIEVKLG